MSDHEIEIEICPPHDFRAAWATNDIGRIFCRFCGDVRLMEPATQGPTTDEQPTPVHRATEDGSGRRG